MTVKELKEKLNDYPDNAEIVLQCDHGQNIESAYSVVVSRTPKSSYDNDYDSFIFEYENWHDCYDEESIENYDKSVEITTVLIQS